MEETTQINNNILRKLEESILEDLDSQVLKYSNQYLTNQADDDILLCKIISLIKLEKYKEALHLQNNVQIKKEAENYLNRKYLHVYTQYRVKDYPKALKQLLELEKDLPFDDESSDMQAESGVSLTNKVQILKAQIYNKTEEYAQSTDIFAKFLNEKNSDPSIQPILEDIIANYFNSLTLLAWLHASKNLPGNPLSKKREEAFTWAMNFCITSKGQITIREVYLNLLITLAVFAMSENPYFNGEEINSKFQTTLDLFYQKLREQQEGNMEADEFNLEENEVSDVVKDKVVANILEAIFMTKRKKVRLEQEKLDLATTVLDQLDSKDIILKASILSYVLYMQTGLDGQKTYFDLGNKIDELSKDLKTSEISKQLQAVIEQNLKFNKAITLFHRGKIIFLFF